MSIADELKKLDGLRWNGTLTEAEFAQAKAALLAQLAPPLPATVPAAPKPPAEDPAEARYRAELSRIDRAWVAERERFLVAGVGGRRYVPTVGEGLAAAAGVGVLGGAVAAGGAALAVRLPSGTGSALVAGGLVLFGLYLAVVGVRIGVSAVGAAADYRRAHAAYRRRRDAVDLADFR